MFFNGKGEIEGETQCNSVLSSGTFTYVKNKWWPKPTFDTLLDTLDKIEVSTILKLDTCRLFFNPNNRYKLYYFYKAKSLGVTQQSLQLWYKTTNYHDGYNFYQGIICHVWGISYRLVRQNLAQLNKLSWINPALGLDNDIHNIPLKNTFLVFFTKKSIFWLL